MSFHEAFASAGGGTRLHTGGLAVQRACACGNHAPGGECEKCKRKKMLQRKDRGTADTTTSRAGIIGRAGGVGLAGNLSGVAPRGPAPAPELRTSPRLQRQPVGGPAPSAAEAPPSAVPAVPAFAAETAPDLDPTAGPVAAPEPAAAAAAAGPLIAEDDAAELQAGQLRKSEFLDRLQSAVCVEADAALAAIGRSSEGCPYLAGWFDYYRSQSGGHVEAALHRYAPETRSARSASEYISLVAARVRRGVERWASTGEMPEGLPLSLPGVSGVADAAGAVASGIGSLFFKAKDGGPRVADGPVAVQRRLGAGRPLESGVRGRMERAFGQSFAQVRTHADSGAARLSREQNARAFTVGADVAFASGEYRPGTMVGDALIAHELAHVVQQGGASEATLAKSAGGASYGALERDADDAAVGAVSSLWGPTSGVVARAGTSLRSGLRLQRCKKETCSAGNKSIAVDFVRMHGATGNPATDLAAAKTVFKPCCVDFKMGKNPTPETKTTTESWLGGDTDAKVAPDCGAVAAEEKTMYDNGRTSHSLTSRMRVFYVQTYSGSASAGYSIPPFCASGAAAPYVNHVVLQNTSSGATNALAHEFGHILLDSGDHETAPNLMGESGGTTLTSDQCQTIYNNA